MGAPRLAVRSLGTARVSELIVACPSCSRTLCHVTAPEGATVSLTPTSPCRTCGSRFAVELRDGRPAYTVVTPPYRTSRVASSRR